jgi:hypothetical protein
MSTGGRVHDLGGGFSMAFHGEKENVNAIITCPDGKEIALGTEQLKNLMVALSQYPQKYFIDLVVHADPNPGCRLPH